MQKKFKHKEKGECILCKKIVDTTIDEWVAVTDFKANKLMETKIYHKKCLGDLISGKGKVIEGRIREKTQTAVKKLMNLLGAEQQVVY